jgi:hypothetical protein
VPRAQFMIISHTTKSIFIHIQKTAGTSIEKALKKEDPSIVGNAHSGKRHLKAREIRALVGPELWSAYYRFAFVRNPWDRLVSWYCMCVQNPTPNRFARYVIANAPTFTDFITRTTTGMGRKTTEDQLDFVTDTEGNLIVDFVGRYEALAADYAIVKERLHLAHDLPRTNASAHTDYRDYYTAETREIVAQRFARDIRHFGYEF